MKIDLSAKKILIRESYLRLVLVSIVTMAATNTLGIVDNVVIGRVLGTRALSAVGFFAPVSVVTQLANVITMGMVILSGNFIGAGQQEKLNSLFKSVFVAIVAVCLLLIAVLIAGKSPISTLLGARGETHRLLMEYIAGFSPSIIFTSLSALMMSLAAYNNETNRSYVAVAAMFFSNFAFNLILAGPLGLFGIGLASSVSGFLSFLIMLPAYVKKHTICFAKGPFNLPLVGQAVWRGLPCLLFIAGVTIKNSLINYSMAISAGDDGVAVANVLASVCAIVGTISGGCTFAFSMLASLYFGEEDREALNNLFCTACKIGVAMTALPVILMMIFSDPLSRIFFETGTHAWQLSERMYVLGFLFFPVNVIINQLMYAYKAQGRMTLVNVMSFLEVALIGVIAVATVRRYGTDAVWLANTWSDLLALAVIVLSVFVWKKKLTLKTQDLLKLPDDFGATAEEHVEYSVSTLEDVSEISKAVIDFSRQRGTDERKANLVGLFVEEVASNIVLHGFSPGKHNYVNVRVVCKHEVIIRVQDDCGKFDPRERMNVFSLEEPEKNIGLRILAKLTKSVDYYNNAGINTLILKI